MQYPTEAVAHTQPSLCIEPNVLHQFTWTNGMDPKFWVQTENQMYHRNLKTSKSPYQSGNLTAFGACLGPKRSGFIIDVGANIGLMSYYFAKCWGATVLAMEPTPKLAQMLTHNMVLNGVADKVTLLQAAAYNVCGPLVIRDIPSQGYVNAIVPSAAMRKGSICSKFTVDGVTLDSLNLERVTGIKVDVEGYEYQVIQGAVDTIKRCRPVVMAEMLRGHFKGYKPDDLYQFFFDLDYVVFDKGARAHGRFPRPCGKKWFYGRDRSDKIFVPKERAIFIA